MPNTPYETSRVCPHERRPGTAFCIHCRHAARGAARDRRNRVLLRGTVVGIVVLTILAGGALAARAIRGRVVSHRDESPTAVAKAPAVSNSVSRAPIVEATTPPSNVTPPPKKAPPLAPILPSGESPLSDGVTAVRTDSLVVVSFDSPMVRTRRAAKFESFVRATLPAIYGRGADSALAHVPDGALAGQGDLFVDLPTRGLRIPAGVEWEIRLYPEIRAGQDGPLIIRYRVSVVSTTE